MNEIKSKILLVDDDPSVLKALDKLLKNYFDVVSSESLSKARHELQKNSFSIALVDQSLPDGLGLQFLSELQSLAPETVRVLISGEVNQSELSQAINGGVLHRLIIKPWDNDYLTVQLLEAYQSHKLIRENNILAKLAITDPVTGVNNHRRLQEVLRIETERATRHGRSLSLLMIDIDHFKRLNDQFGHPVGDALLAEVAQQISASVRTLDTVARYGGEEFAVLMPDTTAQDALKVAERILDAVSKKHFNVPGSPDEVHLSVSIGVADLKANSELVEAADKALYRAKANGRNRTMLAE